MQDINAKKCVGTVRHCFNHVDASSKELKLLICACAYTVSGYFAQMPEVEHMY